MNPTYRLESHPGRWEIWRVGGPCVAILPADQDRREAEKLARLLLATANGPEKGKERVIRVPKRKPKRPGPYKTPRNPFG